MERIHKILWAATAVICLIVGIIIGFALAQYGLMGYYWYW